MGPTNKGRRRAEGIENALERAERARKPPVSLSENINEEEMLVLVSGVSRQDTGWGFRKEQEPTVNTQTES